MQKYDIILWDVDGTLLDFKYSQRHSLIQCFQGMNIPITESIIQRYDKINDGCWKQLELGLITKAELLERRFRILFDEFGIEGVDIPAFQAAYEYGLSNIYKYMEDSLELCTELKGLCRQYVVTNGATGIQRSKLQLSGLYELMEDIFISEQMGKHKPAPGFFEACFERIPDFDKEKTIIIGDSLSSDMKGGFLAGIATCWYNPQREERPKDIRIDYEIRQLREVYRVLGIKE